MREVSRSSSAACRAYRDLMSRSRDPVSRYRGLVPRYRDVVSHTDTYAAYSFGVNSSEIEFMQ